MNLVEKIKNRIEYGYPCMKRLSELSVQDIVTCIEKIWENSCTDVYETLPNGEELIKEYHCKRTFFEDEHDGDYDYGQPYIVCTLDTMEQLLENFEKTMGD